VSYPLSHIALSVERRQFTSTFCDRVVAFYGEVFGWILNPQLSIENERLFIDLPGTNQYLNLRARDEALTPTPYDHFGVYVSSPEEVRKLHAKVSRFAGTDGIEIDDSVQVLYAGRLHTFRFRYLLPLAIEVQHITPGT